MDTDRPAAGPRPADAGRPVTGAGPPRGGVPTQDGPVRRRPVRYRPDGTRPAPPAAGGGPGAPSRTDAPAPHPAPAEPATEAPDVPEVAAAAPEPATDVIRRPDGSAPAVASPDVPGRHRRRMGESPDARPAASYRAEAEAGGRKKTGRRRRPAFWKELPLLVVVALVLTFVIQTFLAKVYVIPSGSMETTLHGCLGCNNDRVLVDKVTYDFSDPEPGDVVVFRGPDSWTSDAAIPEPPNALVAGLQQLGSLIGIAPPDKKDFVKRVIAVGGQTVQCCDSRNRVLVDGEPLDEPYIYYEPSVGQARQDPFGPITVPEGQLWMMGDSRNNSSDSRVPGHGPIPVENVIGKARLIVLPFDRFGWIDDPDLRPVAAGATPSPGDVPFALGLLGVLPYAVRRRRDGGFLPPPR